VIDANFPALSRCVSESLLWRSLTEAAGVTASAWSSSATRRALAAMLALADLRTVSSVGAAAGLLAAAAHAATPEYVRSGLPLFWPIVGIVVLAAIAFFAAPIERAWPRSTLARLLFPRAHDR